MVFLAVKSRRDADLRDYELVFITDRKQLHQQLTVTFGRTKGDIRDAKSIKHFNTLLQTDTPDLTTKTQPVEKDHHSL